MYTRINSDTVYTCNTRIKRVCYTYDTPIKRVWYASGTVQHTYVIRLSAMEIFTGVYIPCWPYILEWPYNTNVGYEMKNWFLPKLILCPGAIRIYNYRWKGWWFCPRVKVPRKRLRERFFWVRDFLGYKFFGIRSKQSQNVLFSNLMKNHLKTPYL